jgi:hypothetical protein
VASDVDIARWRLRSQHLVEPGLPTAAEAVSSLLAVQAENPSQSAWAVASRTSDPDAADLASQLAEGQVLRTHVLRPTWHYVAADDLVWLVELTAPRVRPTVQQQLRTVHHLGDHDLGEVSDLVLGALDGGELTRPELAQVLEQAGRPLSGQELMLLLADLELQALVCSGRQVNGVHGYALVADRVPRPRRLDREEALAELALRYFTGHGPATERDLSYWATLTLFDVRIGLAAVRDRLESFDHDGRTFWHAPGEEPPPGPQQPGAHLLQLLDETYRGYQDSRWVLDARGVVGRAREASIGIVLVDGQLVAAMRRILTDAGVRFELTPYPSWSDDYLRPLAIEAARYGRFLGREPVVDVQA